MTNFIPIFPLHIVVYPGENLNLHIFEPRYQQMIRECVTQKKPFGIPPVIEKNLNDLGTLMDVVEVVKEYEDGTMDVRTVGASIFRILQTIDNVPDKLYSGAIVSYPENVMTHGDTGISQRILEEIMRLYTLFNVLEKFPVRKEAIISYEIAHLVGLSTEQEYELLGIFTELQRLEYIRRHLNNIIPVINELESMKERIQRNGHFRNLSLDN